MDNETVDGERIVVEPAGKPSSAIVLNPSPLEPLGRRRRAGEGRGPTADDECFKCGEKGHWANECREYGGRDGGRDGGRGGRRMERRDSRERGGYDGDRRR